MTSLTPSLSDLKRVRIGRDNARDGLLAFTEYTMPTYMRAPHHIEIADALDRVERGVCKRLMIQEPPRMGKSELASRRFPPFFIGRNPTRQIIQASYSADLGEAVHVIDPGVAGGRRAIVDNNRRICAIQ